MQKLFKLSKQEIVFPLIHKNKETTAFSIKGTKVFEIAEKIIINKGTEKRLFAIILNSSILDEEFKNYIKIDIKETDIIMGLGKNIQIPLNNVSLF